MSEISAEQFLAKVLKTDTCWLWQGNRKTGGYGRLGQTMAHRISYGLFVEPIQPGNGVFHKCDNPPCVRPDHLFSGKQIENVSDMISKKRHWVQKNGMPRGDKALCRKLTSVNVLKMRELRRTTGVTYCELGRIYGVSHTTAYLAVSGRTWSHL